MCNIDTHGRSIVFYISYVFLVTIKVKRNILDIYIYLFKNNIHVICSFLKKNLCKSFRHFCESTAKLGR